MDRQLGVLRIIYAAIVGSVFMYAGFLEFAVPKVDIPYQPALLWGLLAAAVGSTAAVFVLPGVLARSAGSRGATGAGARFTASILRWALSESVAVYGLVLGLLGAPRPWVLGFFAWALVLLALFHPWRRAA